MQNWARRRADRRLQSEVVRTFPAADVAAYYDEWDDRYEAVFGDIYQHLQATDREELLDHMAEMAELRSGERILDAGCGIGGPAAAFANRAGCEIDAVTISTRQATRAREHIAELGADKLVHVHVGDFHQLATMFPPATFDGVYFLESLVHSHDPQAVLDGVLKVLKPGGRVYIKDFYRGRSEDPAAQRVIDECVAATNRICHLTIRNATDVLAMVERAGFVIEVAQPLAVSAYSIEAGHEFCARYGLDVAAGRDFRTTFYLDNLEVRARTPH